MSGIEIKFPDGNAKSFDEGVTAEEIAHSISPGLRKAALAAKIDGEMYDLRRPIESDSDIELITNKNDEGLEVLRHSTAHLMAQALKRLYGDVKFGVGPSSKRASTTTLIWMRRSPPMTSTRSRRK